MTTEMNALLNRLQEAIDAAISDSGRIADIVDEMKKSGHDLCLIVETSAAISPIEAISPIDDTRTPDFVPEPRLASTGEFQLTSEYLEFLQEMKIAA